MIGAPSRARRRFGRGRSCLGAVRLEAERLESRELLTLTLNPIVPVEATLVGGDRATFAVADLPSAPTSATINWGDGHTTTSIPVKDVVNP